MSELDSLRSIFTIQGCTMRRNTFMITSEPGKLLTKKRGGYRPNATITKIQGIVQLLSLFYGDDIYRVNL